MKVARGRSPGRPAWKPWALLALLAPLVCFVVGSGYVGRLSRKIDEATLSIATNGGPSVLYLSSMRNDVRLIEQHALLARPQSVAQDRAHIAAFTDDFERMEVAERDTPDYPGELEAYQVAQRKRVPFFAAVEQLLEPAGKGVPASAEELERLRVTADDLADALGAWSKVNADQIVHAGDTIIRLRHWAVWLFDARDALAFAFVAVGTVLGIRAAQQQMALAEERRRVDQERLAELDVFAGRVAHDLRDLVGVILMRASMGERAQTLLAATEALTKVTHQSHRMSATIDALLTFARAAAKPEPGARSDTEAVVQEVVADARLLAGQTGIAIAVELRRGAKVACDAVVLGVVLANLVRNAVKYMGEGSRSARRITVRTLRRGTDLRFEVEDTGPGLPPGTEARVFEPLVRLAETRSTRDGIGLGLATVKRLVEANHGAVGVESCPGVGCRFWFTLPLVA